MKRGTKVIVQFEAILAEDMRPMFSFHKVQIIAADGVAENYLVPTEAIKPAEVSYDSRQN